MDKILTIILALSLIIIMFGMGLSLVIEDFRQILVRPKAIIAGLVSQLMLMPIIGFVLINTFSAPPEILIGIIILVACPGGATSNLITYLAKGDIALSVSLTAICSFITLLTIPLVINLGLKIILGSNTDVQLNVVLTIVQVLVIVIIPIILGMFIKVKKNLFAEKMEPIMRRASVVIFILVLVGVIVAEKEKFTSYVQQAGMLTVILNVSTMLLGFGIGKMLSLPIRQRISIAIESGIQNGTLAISIATVLFSEPSYGIVPAVYSLVMFLTGGIFVLWCNKRKESLLMA